MVTPHIGGTVRIWANSSGKDTLDLFCPSEEQCIHVFHVNLLTSQCCTSALLCLVLNFHGNQMFRKQTLCSSLSSCFVCTCVCMCKHSSLWYHIAGNFEEETFTNWWKIRFSWIAHFCRTKERHAPIFAEKTFAYIHKPAKLAKVFRHTISLA